MTNKVLLFQHSLTVSCGLAGFHKCLTVSKTTFPKIKSREIVYRKCKYFNSQNFNKLKFVFSNENIDSCSTFNQTFLDALLKKYALLKKKRLRANHVSYASKSMP